MVLQVSRFMLCLAVCAMVIGCVRHSSVDSGAANAASLTTFRQGSLTMPSQADAPKLIYVDVQENAKLAPSLAAYLGQDLGAFRLTDAPSKAGYILHVNILQGGEATVASVRSAVTAGYGKKARFRGAGVHAILADALMVQRKVPSHKRPSRQRMKNASSRNALGSAQMRLAVVAEGAKIPPQEDFSRAMARELAQHINAAASAKR